MAIEAIAKTKAKITRQYTTGQAGSTTVLGAYYDLDTGVVAFTEREKN
jgi:hypothetical protein